MTIDQAHQPLVFIVSGPSGSGKSTLVAKMLEVPGTMFSISSTTRPPRTTESPGKWYDFISEEEFDRRASQGEFLEYARVFGKHWYGTPLERAQQEIQRYTEYDFLVVNDDVERAGREVQAITVGARCLRSCLSERARKILESFGG